MEAREPGQTPSCRICENRRALERALERALDPVQPVTLHGFSDLKICKIDGTLDGRQLWKLTEPLVFAGETDDLGGFRFVVPKDYETDFASVPRVFWPIFPPTGAWCEASVVHDYLCQSSKCSRFLADAIFREAMYRLGVPVWRRVLMYYAVRSYGALFVRKGRAQ